MLTPIKFFSSDDINKLNEDIWRTIYTKGNDFHFGGAEEVKDAREVFAVIQIYGKALQDLYEGKLPKGWKFGEAANKVYIEMLKNPDKGDQPYTYGERLHSYYVSVSDSFSRHHVCVNQVENIKEALKESIETGIQSNRIVFVIWNPLDIKMENPDCFNWGQLRVSEGNKVSIRIVFRSNDAGNAVFANMGAVIRVFVDEAINPAGGELEEVIWTAASEHIYLTDFDMVENLVGKVPEHLRRLMK